MKLEWRIANHIHCTLNIKDFSKLPMCTKEKKRIKLLIRADAKPSIGTGDLISCLYLSEWLEHYDLECILLTKSTQTAKEILKESHYPISVQWLDSHMTIESEISFISNFISNHHIDGLLMEITERSLQDYKNCFSDIWLGTINFDYQIPDEFNFIWNWQVNAPKKLKDHSAKDKILGPDSVLIKQTIWDSKWYKSQQNNLRILVTMGGADQYNFTHRIYNDLKDSAANLHLVLGSGYYHSESMENYSKDLDLKVSFNLPSILDEILESDVVISAGGLTLSELIHLGVPTIVISTEKHQIERCEYFGSKNLITYLGHRQYDRDKLIKALDMQKTSNRYRMKCDQSIIKLTNSLINFTEKVR